LSDGSFLWLSAPKEKLLPGTNVPDLQSWIRNDNLAPDWLRIGTDVTHQSPFDAAFSLSGVTVAEPSALLLLGRGLLALMAFTLKKAYIAQDPLSTSVGAFFPARNFGLELSLSLWLSGMRHTTRCADQHFHRACRPGAGRTFSFDPPAQC
jgi:hypothetical protein